MDGRDSSGAVRISALEESVTQFQSRENPLWTVNHQRNLSCTSTSDARVTISVSEYFLAVVGACAPG